MNDWVEFSPEELHAAGYEEDRLPLIDYEIMKMTDEEVEDRLTASHAHRIMRLIEPLNDFPLQAFAKEVLAPWLNLPSIPEMTKGRKPILRSKIRRPGEEWPESPSARRAFECYRDAGPTRTLIGAYRAASGRKNARQVTGQWSAWYKKHHWDDRARAYDAEAAAQAEALASQENEEHLARYRTSADEVGEETINAARHALQKTITALERLDAEALPARAVPSLARAASNLALAALLIKGQAIADPSQLGLRSRVRLMGSVQ